MTANQWCTRIRRSLQRGGVASDDARMSLRYIYSVLNTYRKTNIKFATDYGKESTLLKYVTQQMSCTPLCEVDKSECDASLWGCNVKKVCTGTDFLALPFHRAITYVGVIDKSTPFIYAEPTDISVKKNTKLWGMFNYFYLIGNNIYIVPSKKLKDIEIIDIRGVFDDPRDVDDRINPDFDIAGEEVEFPILNTSEDEVLRFVFNEFGFTLQTIEDILNNARDDT